MGGQPSNIFPRLWDAQTFPRPSRVVGRGTYTHCMLVKERKKWSSEEVKEGQTFLSTTSRFPRLHSSSFPFSALHYLKVFTFISLH